ncbi:MAG TPA: YceI family protein [Bryobacteraceae bacterium]|nr:YceI family protein [Bryobacteraceae bacterium]
MSLPMKWRTPERRDVRLMVLCISAFVLFAPSSRAQAPVFEIAPTDSRIKFHVKSSIAIAGKFDKWDASLRFQSPDEKTGALEIKIDAASVDTGSGMKNSTLKAKTSSTPRRIRTSHFSRIRSCRLGRIPMK